MKKRKISPKGARQKGFTFERFCAAAFVDAGWLHAKRHLEYQFVEAQGFDLDHTWPFKVQCKRHAKYVNPSVISEVKGLSPGEVPLLITAGNNLPAMAILPFAEFMLIAKTLKEYLNEKEKRLTDVTKEAGAIEWKK